MLGDCTYVTQQAIQPTRGVDRRRSGQAVELIDRFAAGRIGMNIGERVARHVVERRVLAGEQLLPDSFCLLVQVAASRANHRLRLGDPGLHIVLFVDRMLGR